MTMLLDLFREAMDYPPLTASHGHLKQLRDMTNKIEAFVLDNDTARMLAPISYEIAKNLEAARHVVPPYPRVWIEFDNAARIDGYRDGTKPKDLVPRVGWLIDRHPTQHTLYRISYVGDLTYLTGQRPWIVPIAFWWDTEGVDRYGWRENGETGVRPGGLLPLGIPLDEEPSGIGYCVGPGGPYEDNVGQGLLDLLKNLNGELRFVWACLLMLSSGSEFTCATASVQRGTDAILRPNGSVLPLVSFKRLVVHLARRKRPATAARAALAGMHKRYHSVRGHMRTLRNPDGTVRKLVHVRSHCRGDQTLGTIVKTYEVRK